MSDSTDSPLKKYHDRLKAKKEDKRMEFVKDMIPDELAAAVARREFALDEMLRFADDLIVQVKAKRILASTGTILLSGFREAIKRLGLVTEEDIATKLAIEEQKLRAEYGDEQMDDINNKLDQFRPNGD